MSRCIYCNKETQSDIIVKSSRKDNANEYTCCSGECLKKAEIFFKYSSVAMWIYISFIILYLIITSLQLFEVIQITNYSDVFAIVMGGAFLILPFSTKRSAESWSIKATKISARIAGGLLFLMGIVSIF